MKFGGSFTTALALSASLLCGFLFREPACTIRSGDELAALSWLLAVHRGQGDWNFYPMSFSISYDHRGTISIIRGCGKAALPGIRPVQEIPAPESYTVLEDGIEIVFERVP